MAQERNLGDDFERVVEVDRLRRPEPEEILQNPEPYYVVRQSTSEEKRELTEFVDFLNDHRGKRLDSDVLRAQAAQYHPSVRYLDWLSDQPGIPDSRKIAIIGMSIDKVDEIIRDEGKPVNLMGHIVDIPFQDRERRSISALFRLIDKVRSEGRSFRWIGRGFGKN